VEQYRTKPIGSWIDYTALMLLYIVIFFAAGYHSYFVETRFYDDRQLSKSTVPDDAIRTLNVTQLISDDTYLTAIFTEVIG